MFNAGLTIKKANVPGLSQVVDAVVLKAIKAATGGRLRLTMSGECGGAFVEDVY